MNPAPDKQKTENIPQVTPVISTPSVIPPNIPSPATDNLPARNASSIADAGGQPTTIPPINSPPPISPTPTINYQLLTNNTNTPHKFPFMMVTLFLVIVLAGFAGSFLFFSYNGNKSTKVPAKILITPPVSTAPAETVTNPFATASGDLGSNPFASPTAVTNPFGAYQNPFSSATPSGTQTYQNPFEK